METRVKLLTHEEQFLFDVVFGTAKSATFVLFIVLKLRFRFTSSYCCVVCVVGRIKTHRSSVILVCSASFSYDMKRRAMM